MNTKTVTIRSKDTKRVILVDDKIVFIMNDGTVKHCKSTNELIESIFKKNTPVVASEELK